MKLFKQVVLCSSLLASTLVFTSCGGSGASSSSSSASIVNVGILQYVTHGALDQATEGFEAGLKEAGLIDGTNIKLTFQNPESDESSLSAMAKTMVRDNDLVLAVATPAATALQAAAKAQNSDCKILFTAVTDAVSAGLVSSNAAPGGNITGTSDMNPVAEQIDLIKEMLPSIAKVGIIYTISETNSEVQAKLAKAQAEKIGLSTIVSTISDATEITSVARKLISDGAEVIYVPTDNILASNMPALTQVAYESKIAVVCGEPNMVTVGGTISLGIDYFALGKQTATMAADIIKNGKSTATMAVQTQSLADCSLAVNEDALSKIGLTLPDSIKSRLS